ncbi:MAG: TetR/AcrR family transcriptional regulator [Acidobacteria bacterium]|nr:TetR/AcrR family transcriptional regulator [Acidobacteriota bacterium]
MAEKLHTEVRQEQLAQAALGLVASHGLNGLSVARVAHRVGVVPSAVYRHFASKDELLDAVLDLIRNRLAQNVQKVSEDCKDSLECLRRLLMLHAQLIRENQGVPRIIFSEDIFSGSRERKAAVHEIIRGYLKRVADIVKRGQKENQIRRDLDASTVAMMFLGLVQPAAILWQLSDGAIDVTKHAERAWQILAEAIRTHAKA